MNSLPTLIYALLYTSTFKTGTKKISKIQAYRSTFRLNTTIFHAIFYASDKISEKYQLINV